MAIFRTRKNKNGDILTVAVVRRKQTNGEIFQKSKASKKELAGTWTKKLGSKTENFIVTTIALRLINLPLNYFGSKM